MANHHQHINDQDFDLMMLDLFLSENETNSEIQKSIDMNAEAVFTSPVDITIPVNKEKELLRRLRHDTGGFFGYGSLKYLILITFLSSILIYTLTSNKRQNDDYNVSSIMAVEPDSEQMTQSNNAAFGGKTDPDFEAQKAIPADTTKKEVLVQRDRVKKESTDQIPLSEYHPPRPGKPDLYLYKYSENELDHFDFGEFNLKADIEGYQMKLGKFIFGKNLSDNFILTQNKVVDVYYAGNPFKKDFEDMVYINFGQRFGEQFTRTSGWNFSSGNPLPNACRMYYKTEKMSVTEDGTIALESISEEVLQKVIEPFFFKKTEVTNLEYREFLDWVKRYNGYGDAEEFDPEKAYNYTFFSYNQEVVDHFNSNTMNVYPKPDCWTADFPNAYNEPMDKNYLEHPAYRFYPVVGVSYWQALAYLDWRTYVGQQQLKNSGIPYTIEYALPSDIEWELAMCYHYDNRESRIYYDVNRADYTWITDLKTDHNRYGAGESLDRLVTKGYREKWSYSQDGFFHSTMVDAIDKVNSQVINNIHWMGGNVSEWMKESYKDNWLPVMDKRWEAFEATGEKDKLLLRAIEEYYNEFNDQDGRMIRGANWYDERNPVSDAVNYEGCLAKSFIDPDLQHSTVGFRYVIRVKKKDEEMMRRKVQILGQNLPKMDYSMINNEIYRKFDRLQSPPGFSFVPMGSYDDGTTDGVSIQAFYAKKTEVTNFEWMLFLNYLIDHNRAEDLEKCIPNDPEWAYKMSQNGEFNVPDRLQKEFYSLLCFTEGFVKANNIKEIPLTGFATHPVTGISREAALLFCKWISFIYRGEDESIDDSKVFIPDLRLPMEDEWKYMAYAGVPGDKIYPWEGIYLRDHTGCFLANYDWSKEVDTTGTEGPKPVSHYPPNEYGFYDMAGNAAEMVFEIGFTKGGSWSDVADDLRIKSRVKWDGKPSDKVGFRVVMTYLGRIY